MNRRDCLAGTLLVVVLLSGCAGLLGGDQRTGVDPTAVSDRVDQRVDEIETLRATIEQTVETDNRTFSYRARVVYERPDKVNITFLSGAPHWEFTTSNGTTTWAYNETANEAARSEDAIFESVEDFLVGVDQLRSNATFEGNETLAGEDAIELSYAVGNSTVSMLVAGGEETSELGQASANGSTRTRVWIDTETWLPRKTQVSVPAHRNNQTVTVRYENVTVNEPIEDGAFTFEPPADATITRDDRSEFRPPPENTTFYDDRAALTAAVGDVPDPEIPAGFTFQTGARFDGEMTGVELTYSDGPNQIEVVEITHGGPFFDGGETVSIDGTDGRLVDAPFGIVVEWECGGEIYTIAGDTDRETILSVARSVGCS